MTGNSAPFIWKEIPNSPIKFIHCAMFPENKTENVFSTFHHQEIPRRNSICSVTAWPFMRNKNCLSFFTRKNFYKILNLSVTLFSCFLTANIVYICSYFRWLSWPSCVHVQASSYTALFRVSLRGVGPKCVGLARKTSARCNTGSHVFPFFFVFLFSFLHYHTFMLF